MICGEVRGRRISCLRRWDMRANNCVVSCDSLGNPTSRQNVLTTDPFTVLPKEVGSGTFIG